jgi:hypothetical protein
LQPLDRADGGEKIDPEFESRFAHSVAMARYAVMAKPKPSKQPEVLPDPFDEVASRHWLQREALRVAEERWDREAHGGDEFVPVEEGWSW